MNINKALIISVMESLGPLEPPPVDLKLRELSRPLEPPTLKEFDNEPEFNNHHTKHPNDPSRHPADRQRRRHKKL